MKVYQEQRKGNERYYFCTKCNTKLLSNNKILTMWCEKCNTNAYSEYRGRIEVIKYKRHFMFDGGANLCFCKIGKNHDLEGNLNVLSNK